jgi:hypothetical protein
MGESSPRLICKKCNHESWCHHQATGECHSFEWIKTDGPFDLGPELSGFTGVSYTSEYGPPCKCVNPEMFMKSSK